MPPHCVIGHNGHELWVWRLKATFAGLECGTCHTEFSVGILRKLADTRASKNIGTPDVHCCILPPSTVRSSSNICDLLRQCGIQTGAPPAQPAAASTAPPGHIYRLEYRGQMFRMHGIAPLAVNPSFSCNICKRAFSRSLVIAVLDWHVDTQSPCVDFTCCQKVIEETPTGVVNLRVRLGPQTPPQTEPKPMCRWCKGTGRVTLLTTSAPCDCVKQENTGAGWDALREAGNTVKQESVGVGWHVFNEFDRALRARVKEGVSDGRGI